MDSSTRSPAHTPSRALRGAIPRVQQHDEEFVKAVKPDAVMVSITHANRLKNAGETADSWGGQADIITTTTIRDDNLARLSRERELEIVREFKPAYHIPSDYPVYGDDSVAKQRENAKKCARGTYWMYERVPGKTSIIPLIKGVTPAVRAITERTVADIGADIAAFYGAQYFSGSGYGEITLMQDLRGINRETKGFPVLVIGLMSPWTLRDAPENVVAGAGLQQWLDIKRTTDSDTGGTEMREAYDRLANDVADALDVPVPQEDSAADRGPESRSECGDGDAGGGR